MSDTTPRVALPLPHRSAIDRWELPSHFPIMTDKVTLDSAGRVLIPRAVRDELHLEPGDTLAVDSDSEGVTLRPVRPQSVMRKERGVWVFHRGTAISASETNETLANLRSSRGRPASRGRR